MGAFETIRHEAGAAQAVLCETCLERGRSRPAEIIKANLAMCRDCFTGKPFRRQETAGGGTTAKDEIDAQYRLRKREKRLSYYRQWRRRNRERVNRYRRQWYRLQKALE